MREIVLIEDDRDLSYLLSLNFEKENFKLKTFESATEFFKYIQESKPDLVIIDIMLPDLDGFRVAKFLKSRPDLKDIPIIFLTAKGSEEDKLKGFEIGADDYITKPFSFKELLARVKAVLRRYERESSSEVYEFEGIKILKNEKKVLIEGKEVHFTPAEFKILLTLIENYGRPVSREFLLEKISKYSSESTERTVDVHVKHIRDKLGKYKSYIKTVRGYGYKFEK